MIDDTRTRVILSDQGTFTLQEPSTIQFTDSSDFQFPGTLDGDLLTIIGESGERFIYREQP